MNKRKKENAEKKNAEKKKYFSIAKNATAFLRTFRNAYGNLELT